MSAEAELHDAICNAVILLNNGEEIAPEVSAILRTALAKYNPAPPVVDARELQQCPNCLNDGCHCATCNPYPGELQQAPVVGESDQGSWMGQALHDFTEYFAKNYPQGTEIYDPTWHAPKIFRNALWHIEQAQKRDTTPQSSAPVVGEAMVAVAYRVCEDFIEKHGDGYLNELDDGQWNEMLHAALTAALGKGEQ